MPALQYNVLFMMWTRSSHLTLNSWWPRVGGVSCSSLLISLNSQLLMTKGGVSCSSLLISLNSQLLITRVGGGVSCSSLLISLNSQLLMTKGGVSCSSLLILLNSQLLMTKGGVGCPALHCSSHQPSWLQLSSETKLTSVAVCQHSLS